MSSPGSVKIGCQQLEMYSECDKSVELGISAPLHLSQIGCRFNAFKICLTVINLSSLRSNIRVGITGNFETGRFAALLVQLGNGAIQIDQTGDISHSKRWSFSLKYPLFD